MPWTGAAGSQVFTRATGVYSGATAWGQTDAAARGIRSDDHDAHDQDMANGISATLHRGGGNAASANLRMGGFKLTGLGPGTAPGDSVRFEQLPSGVMTTRGDMDYYGASGIARLPKGANGSVLMMGANDPVWTALTGTTGHKVPYLDTTNQWWAAQSWTTPGYGGSVSLFAMGSSFTAFASGGGYGDVAARFGRYAGVSGVGCQLIDFVWDLGGGPAEVGSILITTTATVYSTSSDYRLKKNVRHLTDVGDIIDAIKPRRFKWKSTDEEGIGFIAHELQAVAPEATSGEKDGLKEDGTIATQGVDMAKLMPYVIAELQSLRGRMAGLENAAA